MNFLQLAKRVRQEAGLSGTGPASVANQAGEVERIIDWTRDAWTEIQGLMGGRWAWLWESYSGALVVGQSVYDPASDWSITPKSWDELRLDGMPVALIPWELFRDAFPVIHDGLPTHASVRPDGKIAFSAAPMDTHAVTAEFYALPQILAQNTDEPLMDERYHMAIVWRAVAMAAQFEESPVMQQMAERKFGQIYAQMTASDLPQISMPEPLA